MNIGEMHVTFRELAQQMGMQTVRAILMEDIDICLNAAIIEKARNEGVIICDGAHFLCAMPLINRSFEFCHFVFGRNKYRDKNNSKYN